jgi:hypothetical protein
MLVFAALVAESTSLCHNSSEHQTVMVKIIISTLILNGPNSMKTHSSLAVQFCTAMWVRFFGKNIGKFSAPGAARPNLA